MARLKTWLAQNAPPLLGLLNPPASAANIAAFEARTSLILPDEVRQLYSIHNGEADESEGIFGCLRWMPLTLVAEELETLETDGIFPFLLSGGGDMLYVKAPGNQLPPDRHVYEWWHEVPEEAAVMAESVESYFAEFVADLHAGRYVYRPEDLNALIDRNELSDDEEDI